MATTTLKFCPLQSSVDVSFWSELGSKKLDEYQLSETPIDIAGYLCASRHAEVSSPLEVRAASFGAGPAADGRQGQAPGQLLLCNTAEAMRRIEKPAALQAAGQRLWADILSGAAEAQPQLLLGFLMLAFGDLKHWVFDYWFAFTALKPPAPVQQRSAQLLAAAYPQQQLQQRICAAADAWRAAAAAPDSRSSSGADMFCLMQISSAEGSVTTAPLASWQQLSAASKQQPELTAAQQAAITAIEQEDLVINLMQQQQQQQQQGDDDELLLVMFDPCHLPLTPGWPLRNALLLAAARWRLRTLRVLCVRDSSAGRAAVERSYVLQVDLPELPASWLDPGSSEGPQAVGWEADAAGKLLPRRVDVSPLMSPVQLAEQAVDLNLRLMRWRAAPGLDIAGMAATRCLLLGAGTLGCAVARTLQAWGVRHITLLDSGCVAFSNPVRQSLFSFEDCLGGGKPKAQAAADALRAIFPSVIAEGAELSIPMPGHPPANAQQEQQMQQATEQLAQLVERHDVIFLLTDTRESRWLPSLLAAAAGKLAITAALGFDNYVVMRHGLPPAGSSSSSSSNDSDDDEALQVGSAGAAAAAAAGGVLGGGEEEDWTEL
ncbi:hypothetical protein OEZ85_006333 [Tetradesmus obliquus]|uniref:Autophagy-related protein 7 n=1 Tax=Tetradesmus obliquus TaxID=3088 RepID=A0ABY8TWK7_TETOB|nr:hypothetical protein OEZ85_006333 [Tetradesmus obliquus]